MADFRISVVESRQREIIWLFDHLKALGHACAIMKHRISGQDKFRFTVWREGVEVMMASTFLFETEGAHLSFSY